jgi:hypothetical protein
MITYQLTKPTWIVRTNENGVLVKVKQVAPPLKVMGFVKTLRTPSASGKLLVHAYVEVNNNQYIDFDAVKEIADNYPAAHDRFSNAVGDAPSKTVSVLKGVAIGGVIFGAVGFGIGRLLSSQGDKMTLNITLKGLAFGGFIGAMYQVAQFKPSK